MTRKAANAMDAWNAGARRRRATNMIERAADALAVTGGAMIVSATGVLDLGMPAGPAGIGIGASALVAALAWMSKGRRRDTTPRPAVAVAAPEPAWWTVQEPAAA